MRVLSRSFSSEVPFGFKNVAKDEKQNMVGEVFSKVADNYDKMNDLMSAGKDCSLLFSLLIHCD